VLLVIYQQVAEARGELVARILVARLFRALHHGRGAGQRGEANELGPFGGACHTPGCRQAMVQVALRASTPGIHDLGDPAVVTGGC
jgi:hypothetical protein